MDGCKFIQLLSLFSGELFDFEHVSKLFVTDEGFENFDDFFLKNKIFFVVHDFDHICSD